MLRMSGVSTISSSVRRRRFNVCLCASPYQLALLQDLAELCGLRPVLNDPEAAKAGGLVRAAPDVPEGVPVFSDYLPDEDFGSGHLDGTVVWGRSLAGGRI